MHWAKLLKNFWRAAWISADTFLIRLISGLTVFDCWRLCLSMFDWWRLFNENRRSRWCFSFSTHFLSRSFGSQKIRLKPSCLLQSEAKIWSITRKVEHNHFQAWFWRVNERIWIPKSNFPKVTFFVNFDSLWWSGFCFLFDKLLISN